MPVLRGMTTREDPTCRHLIWTNNWTILRDNWWMAMHLLENNAGMSQHRCAKFMLAAVWRKRFRNPGHKLGATGHVCKPAAHELAVLRRAAGAQASPCGAIRTSSYSCRCQETTYGAAEGLYAVRSRPSGSPSGADGLGHCLCPRNGRLYSVGAHLRAAGQSIGCAIGIRGIPSHSGQQRFPLRFMSCS